MSDLKVFHILTLLSRFAKGEEIELKSVALELGVSLRTMQRYIENITEFYGKDAIKKSKRGCYIAFSPMILEKMLPNDPREIDDMSRLLDIVYITNAPLAKLLPSEYKNLTTKRERDIKEIFIIKENPFEDFSNYTLLKRVKTAILQKRYCNITYKTTKEFIYKEIKPIKLIFAEGNWYLATISDEQRVNGGFKFLRISFIEEIELLGQTFYRDIQALEFCKEFQTLFSSYVDNYFDVEIEVSCEIARFFEHKKHLKSQKIRKKHSDGSLTINVRSNSEMEIFNLLKKWLPHLKITTPLDLRESFEKMIKEYANSL